MNDLLELEAVLLTTNVRTEHLHGREYVVAEAVILREGILNGSDGPLFYSLPEITKNVGMWNGVSIVAPHPYVYEDGKQKHVSAYAPGVSDAFGVGLCYNDRIDKDSSGKPVRKVDLYFDVEKSNRIDGRIIPAVRSREAVNVSTGITTLKRKAVDNNVHNGHVYTHTVHNIGADHLAVLMDEKGACSVFDGCGINVNAENALAEWSLEEINAVVTYNRDWPKSKRESLSKEAPGDFAGPHQSFPIKTQEDVNSAAKLTGHADDPEAVKSKIRSIAKRKGLKVPASWEKKGTKNEDAELPGNKGTSETNNAISTSALKQVQDHLAANGAMPGYGQVYKKGSEIWYVGGDGDEWGEKNLPIKLFGKVKGVTNVHYEAEAFPPEDEGWKKVLNVDVTNAWTDVARQSSILARQRTHATLHWHTKHGHGGKDSWAKSDHLKKLSDHANRAVGSNIQGDSRTALHAHTQAANGHASLAKKATAQGHHEAASLHSDAHAAHLHAASMHKKSVHNVKTISTPGGSTVNEKEELVSWLTTNCDCWKDDGSETVLNTLSEEKLKELKRTSLAAKVTDVAVGIVKKVGSQVGFKGNYNNLPSFVANSVANAKKKPPMKGDDGDDDDMERNAQLEAPNGSAVSDMGDWPEDFGPVGSTGTRPNGGTNQTQGKLTKGGGSMLPESGQLGTTNKEAVLNALKGMTDEEFISVAPPGLRQTLNEGQKAVKEKKIGIINSLTVHIQDQKQKKTEVLHLWKKTIPQLEEIARYASVANRGTPSAPVDSEQQILANFFGQNGAPVGPTKGRPIFNTENVLEPSPDLDLN